MVQVVASPTRQAFRQADMHTASLGKASRYKLSAQEHFQLANIPGTVIIVHKWRRGAMKINFSYGIALLLQPALQTANTNGADLYS